MPISRGCSYAYCERLARREAANFYHGFRLLPGEQRRAMCALYSFMRVTDDLSDDLSPLSVKRLRLSTWREQLHGALAGDYSHPLHPAFAHTVKQFGIPVAYLFAVLDGVEMDLDVNRYATFADLYQYCYRVASAVGLACLHIWGFRRESALIHGEAAGVAFQLTNILRDLGEDAARGRIYIPHEDLTTFAYTSEDLARQIRDDRFHRLMGFQVNRARSYYNAARPLVGLLEPAGRAVYQVMEGTYSRLLDEIERRGYDVFSSRVRVSRLYKLWLAARALPARWGWT